MSRPDGARDSAEPMTTASADVPLVRATIRLRTYDILARAVEEGVEFGLSRAHKHTPKPSQAAVAESVAREVMGALCEVFAFDEVGDE